MLGKKAVPHTGPRVEHMAMVHLDVVRKVTVPTERQEKPEEYWLTKAVASCLRMDRNVIAEHKLSLFHREGSDSPVGVQLIWRKAWLFMHIENLSVKKGSFNSALADSWNKTQPHCPG